MNRYGGGCCIARYGGGGDNMSKVDRIMLRYRPIAPKPDSGGCGGSPPPVESVASKSRRGKRKHSAEKSSSSGSVNSNGNSKRCNNDNRRRNGSGGGGEIVTLPLLPETPEKKDSQARVSTPPTPTTSFGDEIVTTTETVAASLLTVMDGWVKGEDEYELGCTDEERRMNLERDTCPGFISDGLGRVVWTNASYRELVVGKAKAEEEKVSKMSVWLVMKERPLLTYAATSFTCRMRLQYTCRRGKDVSSVTSPCDVWRMNDGGFAWRLDLNAALCLGR